MTLAKKPAILSLDPSSVGDVLDDVRKVGDATGAQDQAERFVASLQKRLDAVKERAALADTRPRVACLEWMEPVLVAGHWVPEMVEMAGGEDVLGDKHTPSFRVEWERVLDARPEVVVITPCGFDTRRGLKELSLFTEREGWDSLPAVQQSRVFVVDASAYFSRSGPRLVDGLEIMAEILHPELFAGLVPEGGVVRINGKPVSPGASKKSG